MTCLAAGVGLSTSLPTMLLLYTVLLQYAAVHFFDDFRYEQELGALDGCTLAVASFQGCYATTI
jgi:hypothetical protein